MNGSSSMLAFDNYLFYSSVAGVLYATSGAMRLAGNTAVLAVTVVNATGTLTNVAIQLQGSYDGTTWENISNSTAISQASFGFAKQAPGAIAYAFVRVAATITCGTACAYLFSASVAFSAQ